VQPEVPPYAIRPAQAGDLDPLVVQYESVAAEGRWIGGEAPIDRDAVRSRYAARLTDPAHYLSVAELTEPVAGAGDPGTVVGQLHLAVARYGVAELGMSVSAAVRGRGIGRALLADAIAWAEGRPDVHKLALQVWPHNEAAQNLYRSYGFEQEGYLRHHYRRRNGEIWDAVVMGRQLS
jgi:RimJ/RimL family protein N-acetyltransferase